MLSRTISEDCGLQDQAEGEVVSIVTTEASGSSAESSGTIILENLSQSGFHRSDSIGIVEPTSPSPIIFFEVLARSGSLMRGQVLLSC